MKIRNIMKRVDGRIVHCFEFVVEKVNVRDVGESSGLDCKGKQENTYDYRTATIFILANVEGRGIVTKCCFWFLGTLIKLHNLPSLRIRLVAHFV